MIQVVKDTDTTTLSIRTYLNSNEKYLDIHFGWDDDIPQIMKKYKVDDVFLNVAKDNWESTDKLQTIASFVKRLRATNTIVNPKGIEYLENVEEMQLGFPTENLAKGIKLSFKNFHNLKNLVLDFHRGFSKDFTECTTIECLNIKNYPFKDLSHLSKMQKIESLGIGTSPKLHSLVGIQSLEQLKYLAIGSCKINAVNELCFLPKLASLGFYNIRGELDLSDLIKLENLEELTIESCKGISDFDFLAKLTNLKVLRIKKCISPENLDHLKSIQDLEFLEISGCKNISDLSFVKDLKTIKSLEIADMGKLPSLEFLYELPNLIQFDFAGTTLIESKDLTPLLDHKTLKKVLYYDKKAYNLTRKEVFSTLEKRYGKVDWLFPDSNAAAEN